MIEILGDKVGCPGDAAGSLAGMVLVLALCYCCIAQWYSRTSIALGLLEAFVPVAVSVETPYDVPGVSHNCNCEKAVLECRS